MGKKEEKTVKGYLFEILSAIKNQGRIDEIKKLQGDFKINLLFGWLAFFSLVLISNGIQDNQDFTWIQNYKYPMTLWGISLAIIYLGISLEREAFFKPLWDFALTKVAISIFLSLLIVFSSGKAAGVINSVFGVDATSFPFTLTFTTAMIVFNYLAPLVFILAIAGVGHLFVVFRWCKSRLYFRDTPIDLPPMNSTFFVILSAFVIYHYWQWSSSDFNEEILPQKVYILAHKLDFNSKHECGNIKSDIPVIFLGNSQSTVLADINSMDIPSVKWFFESDISVPKQFFRMSCDIKSYSGN